MKNQYFGDLNDYQKYGILRALSGGTGIRTTVCWSLTPDNGSTDGSRVAYLEEPELWRSKDPEVFDALQAAVLCQNQRSISTVENSGLLENCRFWGEAAPTRGEDRDDYFARFLDFAAGTDLVFFDPDNGLEVKSCPRGSANSNRYIYWNELLETWGRGHSIVVYQHFPRVHRLRFVRKLAGIISDLTGADFILAFRSSFVVFLLLVQPDHVRRLTRNLVRFSQSWSGVVSVEKHSGTAKRRVPGPIPVAGLSSSVNRKKAHPSVPKPLRGASRPSIPLLA